MQSDPVALAAITIPPDSYHFKTREALNSFEKKQVMEKILMAGDAMKPGTKTLEFAWCKNGVLLNLKLQLN